MCREETSGQFQTGIKLTLSFAFGEATRLSSDWVKISGPLLALGGASFAWLLSINLRDPGEEATHLRSFDPFPGILNSAERKEIISRCAFSH